MTAERFAFGENWADYIERNFSEERVEISRKHLLNFLRLSDLKGRVFLDIGCGSGLHSLAALQAGASKIISFDYDESSVATTRKLHEWAGSPRHWTIDQGSVLDRAYMVALPKADVVYSWGVLHHTGEMWTAVENAAIPLASDGIFYIALYTTDVYIDPTPEYWLKIKKRYNESSTFIKRCMEFAYAYRGLIKPMLRFRKNPLKVISEYKRSRGMSYWNDVRDWLGGWPMEFAGIQETKAFCADKLGLEVVNILAGEANTEYVFRPRGCSNYWDDYRSSLNIVNLDRPFISADGHAWVTQLPALAKDADDDAHPRRSSLIFFEDGVPLGWPHAPLPHVRRYGGSRYRHWKDKLFFSTPDDSDPNHNGRRYSYCANV